MRRYIAPLTAGIAALVLFLFTFSATAFAAGEVTPTDGSLVDLARPIFDQVMAGHWIAASALALVFVVAVAKRYAPGKAGEFLHTDAGGSLATLLMSFGSALGLATVGGAPWTWGMLVTAMTVAFAAAGGYALIKKLIVEPLTKSAWYNTKAPLWLKSALSIVLWMFDRRVAETKAVAAGQAAVEANPPTGVSGVVGDPTEIK